MMAINHEEEVTSANDPKRRVFTYSIEREGKRYSVEVGYDELEACGPLSGAQQVQSVMARRQLVARRLKAAMDE